MDVASLVSTLKPFSRAEATTLVEGCINTLAGDVTTTLWRNLWTPGLTGFTRLSLWLVWGMSPISMDANISSRIKKQLLNYKWTIGNMKEGASSLCYSYSSCPAKVRSVFMNPSQRSTPSKVLNCKCFVVLR